MACYARVTLRIEVQGPGGLETVRDQPVSFQLGVGDHVKQEKLSLTGSAFTALSPPTGAKLLLLALGDAPSLSLKSVTGDGAGLTITPSTLVLGGDHLIWLGDSPTIGIYNADSDSATGWAFWF